MLSGVYIMSIRRMYKHKYKLGETYYIYTQRTWIANEVRFGATHEMEPHCYNMLEHVYGPSLLLCQNNLDRLFRNQKETTGLEVDTRTTVSLHCVPRWHWTLLTSPHSLNVLECVCVCPMSFLWLGLQ